MHIAFCYRLHTKYIKYYKLRKWEYIYIICAICSQEIKFLDSQYVNQLLSGEKINKQNQWLEDLKYLKHNIQSAVFHVDV